MRSVFGSNNYHQNRSSVTSTPPIHTPTVCTEKERVGRVKSPCPSIPEAQNNVITQVVDRWLPAFADFSHQLAESSVELAKSRIQNEQLAKLLRDVQTQLDNVKIELEQSKAEKKSKPSDEVIRTPMPELQAVQDSLRDVSSSLREFRQWLPVMLNTTVKGAIVSSLSSITSTISNQSPDRTRLFSVPPPADFLNPILPGSLPIFAPNAQYDPASSLTTGALQHQQIIQMPSLLPNPNMSMMKNVSGHPGALLDFPRCNTVPPPVSLYLPSDNTVPTPSMFSSKPRDTKNAPLFSDTAPTSALFRMPSLCVTSEPASFQNNVLSISSSSIPGSKAYSFVSPVKPDFTSSIPPLSTTTTSAKKEDVVSTMSSLFSFPASKVVSQPSTTCRDANSLPKFGQTFNLRSKSPLTENSSFAISPKADLSKTRDEKHESPETYEPCVEFRPCVEKLPDLIDKQTGEEHEERLFSQHARLFRWEKACGEWKARGIGEIRILYDRANTRYRIVMRRDQIKKLCANHAVSPGLNIRRHPQNTCACLWSAKDFANMDLDAPSSEGTDEVFMVTFKTADLAQGFEDTIKECLRKLAEREEVENSIDPAKHTLSTSVVTLSLITTSQSKHFSNLAPSVDHISSGLDKLRPKPGVWECSVCSLQIEASSNECPACKTIKPNVSNAGSQPSVKTAVSASGVSFFCSAPAVTKTMSSQIQPTSFRFGAPPPQVTQPVSLQSFSFSALSSHTSSPRFMFESQKKSDIVTSVASSKDGSFTNLSLTSLLPATGQFNFSFKPSIISSPSSNNRSNNSTDATSSRQDHNKSDYDDGDTTPTSPENFDFAPILEKLPDKIVVFTGEEDEEVIFSGRAKLYRFLGADGWKERGIGNLKILRSSKNNRFRLVMRRDQIFKVCCNHPITSELSLQPLQTSKQPGTDEPVLAWLWWAIDFSETDDGVKVPDGRKETFSVRFKMVEDSDAFFKAFTDAVKQAGNDKNSKSGSSFQPASTSTPTAISKHSSDLDVSSSEDSDLIIIDQCPTLSSEQLQRARALKLPEDFYSYESQSGRRHHHSENLTPEEEAAEDVLLDAAIKAGQVISLSESLESNSVLSDQQGSCSPNADLTPTPRATASQGLELLKQKPGSWECTVCTLMVDEKSFKCPACQTVKPNATGPPTQAPHAPPPAKTEESKGEVFLAAKSNFVDFSSLSAAVLSSNKPSWLIPSSEGDSGAQRTWPGFGTSVFASNKSEVEETPESDVDPHFEPIVPLPSLVERRTGEENEICLFLRRCRLYRMVDGAWKERGIGDMKILISPKCPAPDSLTSNRTELPNSVDVGGIKFARLLMRRDQVLKICANHAITANMPDFKPLTSVQFGLCWVAEDYSEGTSEVLTLGLKFKTEQDLTAFKESVSRARALFNRD